MASLTPSPKMQFVDANGNPLSGGKLYTYATGTTTPLPTYTDSTGLVQNTNPVILDSRGEASVWLGSSRYSMTLKNSADALVWTADGIGGYVSLSELAASGGALMVGYTQGGTGSVATTVQAKLRESVSVKDFGAVGDGVTDDTAAVQAAANAHAMYFPEGVYKITGTVTLPTRTIDSRPTYSMIRGDGRDKSIILNSAAAYAFTYAGGDNIAIHGLTIKTTTGGGLTVGGDVGGFHVDDFWMDGCASGFSAVKFTTGTPYTFTISRSRFWANAGYFGQVLDLSASTGGIDLSISDSFISQQRFNGDLILINNAKNLTIRNVQLEGANPASTLQTFIALTGYNFNVLLDQVYVEGNWDKVLRTNGGATKGLQLRGVFAWEYTGKASPIVMDISDSAFHSGIEINGLTYVNSDTGVGTGFVINDPNNLATIINYNNGSSGNQASRALTQNPNKETFRETGSIGFVSSGAVITKTIQLPSISGEYEVSVTIISQDANHQTNAKYRAIWNSGHSNNWAATDILGTVKTVGALAPTGLAVSVNTSGIVTATATSAQTGTYSYSYSWRRLGAF